MGVAHAAVEDCILAVRTGSDAQRAAHAQRRQLGIRRMIRFAGFGLVLVGSALSVADGIVHLAIALPVSDLVASADFVDGMALAVAGLLLAAAAQVRLSRRRAARLTPVATLTVHGSI